jgi:hypothetical protein
MLAGTFVALHGEKLIGKTVMTEAMGSYPGGPATVLRLFPDREGDPTIVMQVTAPTEEDGEIGVFDYEDVEFC